MGTKSVSNGKKSEDKVLILQLLHPPAASGVACYAPQATPFPSLCHADKAQAEREYARASAVSSEGVECQCWGTVRSLTALLMLVESMTET